MREVFSSKIHRATVTRADLDYIGSITIDSDLMQAADLWAGQKVHVFSITSGARLETYVIEGEPGSGAIEINGAAAHLIKTGEMVIIIGYTITDQPVTHPRCVLVDANNKPIPIK